MKDQTQLIGYALSFASFLLDSKIGDKINKIILFGSVARGDFNPESDIDLFIDADKRLEKEINNLLLLFKFSEAQKVWEMKKVTNGLSLKVGSLSQWGLRREVISSGIILYGKFQELPEKTKYYALFQIESGNKKVAHQMRIWRKLYGYTQKIGKKRYTFKGLIDQFQGRKLGKAVFIVPMENRREVIVFLNKSKVKYSIHELWSDSF